METNRLMLDLTAAIKAQNATLEAIRDRLENVVACLHVTLDDEQKGRVKKGWKDMSKTR